ncbi:hypothetical protein BpHYR1_015727 [Brachionus plicatilis]|uniref:Uncharacterized protein n=1 Tax=Brachionus plicatilis TaxID=10195 RepID=A0A3M7RP40_BRAPC|nr:hypothetical protein BpHYR1_015727 [Brachionus plicatilis]
MKNFDQIMVKKNELIKRKNIYNLFKFIYYINGKVMIIILQSNMMFKILVELFQADFLYMLSVCIFNCIVMPICNDIEYF